MAYVDWLIRGPKLASCSCNYGCPCEFNAPPTHGECEGMEAMEVEEGWFGAIRLDGVRFAAVYRWPGPVHEGGGIVQGIIDVRTSEPQRDALFKILGGQEQAPHTCFNIYNSTIEKELDPVFAPIEFEFDDANARGRFRVEGLLDSELEPIRNPVTGEAHRARIVLPNGFEFREAEMASSRFRASAGLSFEHAGRYGFLTRVAYGPHGLIP